jgi:hypothetical protein
MACRRRPLMHGTQAKSPLGKAFLNWRVRRSAAVGPGRRRFGSEPILRAQPEEPSAAREPLQGVCACRSARRSAKRIKRSGPHRPGPAGRAITQWAIAETAASRRRVAEGYPPSTHPRFLRTLLCLRPVIPGRRRRARDDGAVSGTASARNEAHRPNGTVRCRRLPADTSKARPVRTLKASCGALRYATST